MPDSLMVKRSRLVALFVACGVDTAANWDRGTGPAKLRSKLDGGMKKYREPGAAIADPELEALFTEIVAAQTEGRPVEIDDDVTGAAPAKAAAGPSANGKPKAAAKEPAAPKGGKKPAAVPAPKVGGKKKAAAAEPAAKKPRGGMSYAERREWKKTNAIPITDRGPGVSRFIVEQLQKASQSKPLTKAVLLERMKLEFPDRDATRMATTINNHIPSRLRTDRHIHVWKMRMKDDSTGYWIEGDGSTPQPDQPKEPRVPKVKVKPAPEPVAPRPKAKAVKRSAAKPVTAKPAAAKGRPTARPAGKKSPARAG